MLCRTRYHSNRLPRFTRRSLLRHAHSKAATSFADFTPDVQKHATNIEDARSSNHQIPLLTTSYPNLKQDTSYRISAAIRVLRAERHGDRVFGRKIGFTNKSIWPEYNVDRSNWSYMYDSSITDLASQTSAQPYACDLSAFSNLEPKIEPEIVLGLNGAVDSSMDDMQLLDRIEWIVHGFEIVVSVFPGWKFTAADTTAAGALHGKLLLGPKRLVHQDSGSPSDLLRKLETFQIRLLRNGSVVDEGAGRNVLGSPIKALRHLVELLENDQVNLPIGDKEMVTTGTLTKALSISDGDRWQTEIEGLDVAPLDARFQMKPKR